MVVDVACFFLQVKLDPVVKTNEFITTTFPNKNMFKTARVVSSEKKHVQQIKIVIYTCDFILYNMLEKTYGRIQW